MVYNIPYSTIQKVVAVFAAGFWFSSIILQRIPKAFCVFKLVWVNTLIFGGYKIHYRGS